MLIYKKYTKCETSIGEHKEENGKVLFREPSLGARRQGKPQYSP